jgi:hypothetical protein
MDDAARDELLIRLDERTLTIQTRLEKGDACMENLSSRVKTLESCEDGRKGAGRTAVIIAGIISTCGVVISIAYTVFGRGA